MASSSVRGKLRLNRPFNQNLVAASMLFCLPGIYVAITGLGAGGGKPSSLQVANNVNAIIYAFFAFGSIGVGFILNILKPKTCLMMASVGYPLYVGGLWYYDRSGNTWLVYLSGVISGLSAALLWTTCAYIQFCYPEEHRKALYISIQWAIRSVGATTGSFVAFGANFHSTTAVGVSTPVYAAYTAIQGCAVFIAFFLIVDPKAVVRDDGTHIAIFKRPGFWSEITSMVKVMFDVRYVILIIPMFCCEMALGLLSSVNARSFNLRSRALNNALFNVIQFFVPPLLTWILDNQRISTVRRTRGIFGIAVMGTIAVGASAGLVAWLQVHGLDSSSTPRSWDWSEGPYPALGVIYTLFGSVYSGYQMVTEWTLSATTNDPEQLARIAGLFKFWSGLGMFVSFLLAAGGYPFLHQTIVQLVLYAVGIVCVIWTLIKYVPDTNYFLESNVIAPDAMKESALQHGFATAEQIEEERKKEERAAGVASENSSTGSVPPTKVRVSGSEKA